MTRDEVVDLIGTIAKSGTAEMLAQLREAREAGGRRRRRRAELIGQFGVGFYSSFMVADRVALVTRKAGAHARRALGVDRRGHLHVADEPGRAAGHRVTLHLKPEDAEDALHDYAEPGDGPRRSSSATPTSSPGRSGWRPAPAATTATHRRRVNSRKALWARPQ